MRKKGKRKVASMQTKRYVKKVVRKPSPSLLNHAREIIQAANICFRMEKEMKNATPIGLFELPLQEGQRHFFHKT